MHIEDAAGAHCIYIRSTLCPSPLTAEVVHTQCSFKRDHMIEQQSGLQDSVMSASIYVCA